MSETKVKVRSMFAVEMVIGDKWYNVWTNNDGTECIFRRRSEAKKALADHFKEWQDAYDKGFMNSVPDPTQFRVVRLTDMGDRGTSVRDVVEDELFTLDVPSP